MYTKVNCKDCAHFDGCRRTYASAMPGDLAYADFEKNEMYDCSAFMPKTEWVHLPCEVGDTAYFVSAGGVHDFTVGTVAVEVSEEGTLYYIVDKDWLWEGYLGDNVFLDKLQAENKYEGIPEDEKPKTKKERKKQWLKDHGIEEIDHLSGQTDVIAALYQEIMKEEQEKNNDKTT